MSNNRLELHGLDALRAALRELPEDLANEGAVIVQAHAEDAARQVRAGYPEVTGNLKRGVSVQSEASRAGAVVRVRSRARHSHLFEKGTGPRRTSSGANRGRMPAASETEAAIPKYIQARRRMVAALIQLVQRAGFVVTSS